MKSLICQICTNQHKQLIITSEMLIIKDLNMVLQACWKNETKSKERETPELRN